MTFSPVTSSGVRSAGHQPVTSRPLTVIGWERAHIRHGAATQTGHLFIRISGHPRCALGWIAESAEIREATAAEHHRENGTGQSSEKDPLFAG